MRLLVVREACDDNPEAIMSPEDAAAHWRKHWELGFQEDFRALFLDTKHRIVGSYLVARGGLNAAVVHPADMLKAALAVPTCAAVILMHNHPSGDPSPSDDDIMMTRRFGDALRLLGLDLLDHVIIGDGEISSLRDKGLLD